MVKINVRHWMNRVDRKLVLYLALFAILIFSAPYFTGYLVETKFKDVAKVVSEFELIDVKLIDYHRGWLTSHAKTQVAFKGKYARAILKMVQNAEGLQNPELSIILEHDIHHGPFVHLKGKEHNQWLFALAAIQSKLHLTKESKKILLAEMGESQLVQFNSEISIKGSVHATVESLPLKLKQTDKKERVFWKGMNSEWDLTRDLKGFKGEINLAGFDLYSDQNRNQAEDVRFKTERFKTSEGLWLGKVALNIKSLSVIDSTTNQLKLALAGLALGNLGNKEGEMLDISSKLHMDLFKYAQYQYGPLDISTTLKNIDWHVAKAFAEIIRDMHTSDESQQAAYFGSLVKLLPDLLKTRPEFNIDELNIHADQGDIKGLLSFVIGGPNANEDQMQIFQSIAAKLNLAFPKLLLVQALTHQYTNNYMAYNELARQMGRPLLTDAEISVEVVKKVNETILGQIKQGYLVENENNYVVEAQLQQGKLTMNGNSVTNITAPLSPAPVLPAPPPPPAPPAKPTEAAPPPPPANPVEAAPPPPVAPSPTPN